MHPWQDEDTVVIWFIIGLILVLLLSIAFVFLLKANYKKHLKNKIKIKDLRLKHIKKLELTSVETQEKERKRIGSDLHDSVINSLNILYLKSQSGLSEEVLVDNIQETILLTRRISHDLNPPLLEYENIEHLLKDLLNQWNAFYSIHFHISKQDDFSLNTDEKMHLMRIVQELMSNIYKHAQASVIHFNLRLSNKFFIFSMIDNGKGFDYDKRSAGLGLKNIQVRSDLLKASFKYKQEKSSGTVFLFLLKRDPV